MYAVINTQGHQYIVQEGSQIVIDKMADVKEGDKVTFDSVYCTFDKEGKKVAIGKPTVSGAKVTGKVVAHKKGDKIRVLKFQGKKRYQRKIGFRPHQTVVLVEKIS